jgi:ribonuclease HIII
MTISNTVLSLYTTTLTGPQLSSLKIWLEVQRWQPFTVDHAVFAFKGNQVNVVAYHSGKIVVQGKKTQDFVTFVLEGEITGTPTLGYEEIHHPSWFEAHAGLDESGKGDLFGPLVTACVVAEKDLARTLIDQGVKDSKRITSDQAILKLDNMIRHLPGVTVQTAYANMERYNTLYTQFGNLNVLLGWMHSKSLSGALEKQYVPWGLLDQFSKAPIVQRFFKHETFDLRMQTKAESDPVVAAASIVARAAYIKMMEQLSQKAGEPLLRGASKAVLEQGKRLIKKLGKEALGQFAKLHFKTAQEVLDQCP